VTNGKTIIKTDTEDDVTHEINTNGNTENTKTRTNHKVDDNDAHETGRQQMTEDNSISI